MEFLPFFDYLCLFSPFLIFFIPSLIFFSLIFLQALLSSLGGTLPTGQGT
jgi:hypothetical protein